MRVVGIVAPFALLGMGTRKIFVLASPRGGGNGTRRRVPGAPSNGMPQERQTQFRDRTVWGLCRGPVSTGPRGLFLGKIRFIEKSGVQDLGVAK